MNSAIFLPVIGIRAGSTGMGMNYWPDLNEIWEFAGPCRLCKYWGVYGDAGDYCLDCN